MSGNNFFDIKNHIHRGENPMTRIPMRKNILALLGIVLILSSFTMACSKKLMPPEIEAQGTAQGSEGDFQEAALAEPVPGAETDPWGLPVEGDLGVVGEESPFLSEDDVVQEGDLGAVPGNGSSGAFEGVDAYGNPMTGNGAAGLGALPGGGNPAESNLIQDAKMFNFRPTAELKDIHFKFDKYDLDGQSKEVLSSNASFLKQNPLVKVEIQGHCDDRGTNNYNLALGHRRAISTKKFLVAQGVDENRLRVISYGEEKPFCPDNNENCWWRNRRAHFMVSK